MMMMMMRRVVGLSPDQGNDSPVSQSGGQSPIFNSNEGEDDDDDGKMIYTTKLIIVKHLIVRWSE